MMRILLGAILGIAMASSPLLARQEPAEKEKQKQPEPKNQEPPSAKTNTEKKQEPPAKKQEPPPSARQEKSDEKRQQQDAKQQQKETEKQSRDNDKKSRENNQPQPQQRQQQNGRQYAQESHPKGERIPPQKFDEHFGSEHHFRVRHLEEGRRFEYSGYAFELVEPWPAGWSYDDECYIEQEEDDYYLVDVFHPHIRVLVIVV